MAPFAPSPSAVSPGTGATLDHPPAIARTWNCPHCGAGAAVGERFAEEGFGGGILAELAASHEAVCAFSAAPGVEER